MNVFFYGLVVFCLGATIGSFLNVCIYRLPLNKSIVFPSSFCPFCSKPLHWYDNIPLLSYWLLHGKCRLCGYSIPRSYFWVEFFNTMIYLLLALRFMKPSQFFLKIKGGVVLLPFVFASFLLLVTVIDWKHQLILDKVTVPALIFFLMISFFNPWSQGFPGALLGVGLGGGFLAVIAYLSRGGMGGGDIKFAAVLGAFLGVRVVMALILAFMVGAVVGLFFLVFKVKERKDFIPFGPFLAGGAFLTVLWPEEFAGTLKNFFTLLP